ncbi:alpha-D-ribose 1-methylphosphonate 5-triphosphate diphosphatase [Geminicoccus roseus]|uniref:alpha-D-ribose 1-methylphosphonate 5-triphosphate diphosphatase n=1 Tax=Geminicoccus roseus TaxID=404900 RepID=UPI00041D439C|nr:alpha-D-ribose 1-methylphosphonate 5-triphosphate diphosphatase [Geminicoccus roseus]
MRSVFSERVLVDGEGIVPAAVVIADGQIAEVRPGQQPAGAADLGDLLLMPGLVDVHGDSFERQLMPRPGLLVDPVVALFDTDSQLLASGITTAFHGISWSWESGLRSFATGRRWIEASIAQRDRLGADHRVHLRFEAYAKEGVDEAVAMIVGGRIGLLAFNDHTPSMLARFDDEVALTPWAQRAQVTVAALREQLVAVRLGATALAGSVHRLIAAARAAGVPTLSHDDRDRAQRQSWRRRGIGICEFPLRAEVAADAAAHGEAVVAGAPNIVRGGSHTGWVAAAELVANGHCTALASDYWYPSLLQAPWRIARDGILPLDRAILLATAGPAALAGLSDRGRIRPGQRADLICVDDRAAVPRVAATWVNGRMVFQGMAAGLGPVAPSGLRAPRLRAAG